MKDMNIRTIYESDKFIKMGFFVLWREMVLSLFRSRELIWRLFLRDFSARYRQSFFGVLWAVLNPVITVGIFVILNRSGILNIGKTSVPYPVFALIGISVYGIFSTGLSLCSNSIVGAGSMVVKINFPKASLVIASMGQAIVELLVRLVVIIILMIIYGIVPMWTSVFFPFVLFPVILLTLGVGFILSLMAGVLRDVAYFVSFLTTLFLFLVPALYPAPQIGILSTLNKLNPLSHLIIGCRDMMILGHVSDPAGFLLSSLFSVVIFLISWMIFYISEPRIAERV